MHDKHTNNNKNNPDNTKPHLTRQHGQYA
jgi:hypothetical protein